jgi:hypothetical protein
MISGVTFSAATEVAFVFTILVINDDDNLSAS